LLAALPLVSLAFMLATQRALQGQFAGPGVFLAPFRIDRPRSIALVKLGLAYAIDAYADGYADVGVLGIYAGCAAKDAGRLAQVAAGELRGLANRVEAVELARGKAQLKASLFMGRESLLNRAEQAAAQHLAFGRLFAPTEIAGAIDAVTVDDLIALGSRMLAPGRCAVSALGPKSANAAAARFEAALFG